MQPVHEARQYNLRKARADAIAGLTVAVVAVPQSMAYAIIAGVPAEYGLYTVIIQCLIGSLLNSQRFLSVGPINTQSLLVAATVTRVVGTFVEPGMDQAAINAVYLELVILLTLIKGLLQLGLSAAKLGNLVRYVSGSVIIGFTAGAGVLIAAGQISNFLGFATERSLDNWPGLIGIVQRIWPHMGEISPPSVAIGVLSLVIVVGARFVSQMAPGPLLAVVISAVVVGAFGWTQADLPLIAELPWGLPAPQLPEFSWMRVEALLSGALALALLGLMEAYSIGKSIAGKTGDRISANQELLSQGFTNFTSSFFQCIPGSGSFSRSALNYYAGAKTLYAGVFNSLFVAMIFLLFSPLARYIPMASLAAILFVIAYGLVDWRAFRRMLRTSRADAIVCAATFLSTLFIPLEYAVFVGITLNIALYMRRASQLHMNEMVQARGGPLQERPVNDRSGESSVVFLSLEGDLFFGVADELHTQLTKVAGSGVRVIILRLKRTHMVDATVLEVLNQFAGNMRERDRYLLLCGVRPELHEKFRAYGLSQTIGEENIFETQFGVFSSAKSALRRARDLVGQSIDADELLAETREEETRDEAAGPFNYQI